MEKLERYGSELTGGRIVVVAATLTSLAISFTITPSLAGNWSLLSEWQAPNFITAFSRGFQTPRYG